MAERISRARLLAYALGSAGFQITDRIVVVIAVYFYLPPDGRGLDSQVPTDVFFGFLTVYGVAMLVGRLFDSAADPLVGHWSDRSRARLGRRRSFLVAGIVPMVAIPVLLFWPPGAPGSAQNGIWLAVLLAAYFIAFTVYVAPYLALIPELAPDERARVRLGTLLALVSFPAVAVFGTLWTLGLEAGRAVGMDAGDAVRAVVVGASVLALVLCAAPIFAVDEGRFVHSVPSDLSMGSAVARTLRDRPFRVYLGAQLAFLFGVNLVQPSLPYVATVLLGRSEGFAAALGGATFAGIVIGFALMASLVRRFGAKRMMMASVGVFAVGVACLGLLRPGPAGGPDDAWNLAVSFTASTLLGPPVAGLLVLPHVLISQLIDADTERGGTHRAAMYFGVQGFLTKWIYGVSLWALTFLLSRFGSRPEEPLGVLLVGPVAGAACLLSLALYARYPERELLRSSGKVE